MELPIDEQKFIAVLTNAKAQFSLAPNDMAKGAIRPARAKEICAALPNEHVHKWIGNVDTLSSNSDGLGVLSLELESGIKVTTWNNSLSDIEDHTLISPQSAIFKKAVALSKGDLVIFDGQFIRSEVDCLREASLTIEGSITEPEFIFRFSDISAVR